MEVELKVKTSKEQIQSILKDVDVDQLEYSVTSISYYSHNGEELVNPKNDVRIKDVTGYQLPPPSTSLIENKDKNFAAYNRMQQIVDFLTKEKLDSSLIAVQEIKIQIISNSASKEANLDKHAFEAFQLLASLTQYQPYLTAVKRSATLYTNSGFKFEFTNINNSDIYFSASKKWSANKSANDIKKSIMELFKKYKISEEEIDSRSWKEIAKEYTIN